jgi:hypothetical protein
MRAESGDVLGAESTNFFFDCWVHLGSCSVACRRAYSSVVNKFRSFLWLVELTYV